MASCLLSSPRIHSPPDSLMRRTSVTKVSGNRVFQQAVKGPPGGPLPTCPSCGAKLEYLKVVQLNSPFSCPNCRAELCVPRLYGLLGFWLSLANSVLLSIAIGLRGLYLLLGVLLMFLPVTMVTAFLRRHSSPPRLTIYGANVSL